MPQRRTTIRSEVGLHARPAAELGRAAANASSPVRIAKVTDEVAGDSVDAASVLGLMTLGARQGDEVELSTDVESDLDELIALLERDEETAAG